MTSLYYKSTLARLVALYKVLGLWNHYTGDKNITC